MATLDELIVDLARGQDRLTQHIDRLATSVDQLAQAIGEQREERRELEPE